jgi:hypothetical protein
LPEAYRSQGNNHGGYGLGKPVLLRKEMVKRWQGSADGRNQAEAFPERKEN